MTSVGHHIGHQRLPGIPAAATLPNSSSWHRWTQPGRLKTLQLPMFQQQQHLHLHPQPCAVRCHQQHSSAQQLLQTQQQQWQTQFCRPCRQHQQHLQLPSTQQQRLLRAAAAGGTAAGGSYLQPDSSEPEEQQAESSSSSSSSSHHASRPPKAVPPRITASTEEETYSLKDTQILVETAMLSAVSGLAFLLSTLLKLDNSLGYFLPLPIAIAACRNGVSAAWHTMMATAFLLLVLLGPLRAITYVLMHGMLAAALGSMWVWSWPWAISITAGAALRMAGQLSYLLLSSFTMNENLFAVMLANVHNLLDRLSAVLGSSGSPSTLTISCMIFALLLVNGICYVFLLHVVYHVILGSMGFKLGPVPQFVRKYLYPGTAPQPQQQLQQQQQQQQQ